MRQEFAVIDAHVAGAPVRLLVGGVARPTGTTMVRRRSSFARQSDQIRQVTVLEPRGHRDLVGVLLTEPVSKTSDAGLLFLDAGGYPPLGGAAVVAATTIALERGLIVKAEEPGGDPGTSTVRLDFDTPAGLVVAHARVDRTGGALRVPSVRVTGVPSFVAQAGCNLALGSRRLRVDIAFSGGFYAIVDSEAVGIPLVLERLVDLRRLGADICAALEGHEALVHPDGPDDRRLEGAIFTGAPQGEDAHLRSATILAHGGCTRSPGVAGSGALMAVLHAMGLLQQGDEFVHEGLLDLTERGRVVGQTRVGDVPSIVPEVTGTAWITGEQTLLVEDDDPLRDGFSV